eukprot:1161187-Pelagomonas_calceolata.AAC.14
MAAEVGAPPQARTSSLEAIQFLPLNSAPSPEPWKSHCGSVIPYPGPWKSTRGTCERTLRLNPKILMCPFDRAYILAIWRMEDAQATSLQASHHSCF